MSFLARLQHGLPESPVMADKSLFAPIQCELPYGRICESDICRCLAPEENHLGSIPESFGVDPIQGHPHISSVFDFPALPWPSAEGCFTSF